MVVSKSSLVIGRKVQSVINQLPHIDGHFWIVRDGKIVDPYFKEYDLLVKFHNGKKGSFIHKPADNMTQLVIENHQSVERSRNKRNRSRWNKGRSWWHYQGINSNEIN